MTPLTHDSRRTHGVVSEPHMSTPDRKGREGKGVGKGKGNRRAQPASWRLVTYRARFADAMMALAGEVEA